MSAKNDLGLTGIVPPTADDDEAEPAPEAAFPVKGPVGSPGPPPVTGPVVAFGIAGFMVNGVN